MYSNFEIFSSVYVCGTSIESVLKSSEHLVLRDLDFALNRLLGLFVDHLIVLFRESDGTFAMCSEIV